MFTASPKWRVELRAKIGHYRNRCLRIIIKLNQLTAYFSFWIQQYKRKLEKIASYMTQTGYTNGVVTYDVDKGTPECND